MGYEEVAWLQEAGHWSHESEVSVLCQTLPFLPSLLPDFRELSAPALPPFFHDGSALPRLSKTWS